MAKIICTRSVSIHKPKDKGGILEKTYLPGDLISEAHYETISPSMRPKCTNMGVSATEAHEAATAVENVEVEEDSNPDGLDDQKVGRLRNIAQEEGVEVAGSAKKSNLIAAIRANREG